MPEPGRWVRIKNGLYEKDIGIVERIERDDRVCVRLIPRIEPSALQKRGFGGGSGGMVGFKKKMMGQRLPQRAFN